MTRQVLKRVLGNFPKLRKVRWSWVIFSQRGPSTNHNLTSKIEIECKINEYSKLVWTPCRPFFMFAQAFIIWTSMLWRRVENSTKTWLPSYFFADTALNVCRVMIKQSGFKGINKKRFFIPFLHHTVRNLHFLSKNSTLISRENRRFFWVKNSWKCCGFGLFSCWQLWFHEKNGQKKFGQKTRENVGVL